MKNWSLLPWGKSYNSANVSVEGEKKNDYKSLYDAEAGDLAVVGYGHSEKDFYPTLSYGKSGIVKWCSKEGAAKKDANELEYVFTQKIDAEKIEALAKAMSERLTEKNMLYKFPYGCAYYDSWFETDNAEWVYIVRSMTRRLLAAVSVAAHPELATAEALASAKRQLAELPMRLEEHRLLYCEGLLHKVRGFDAKEDANIALGYLGFDFLPGMAWDEPETMRMRAELLKNDVMRVFADGSYERMEAKKLNYMKQRRVEKGVDFEFDADEKLCYEVAAIVNMFTIRKKPTKTDEEILCRCIDRCVMIDAVSVMMKYGLVNLLQTYLLAEPPLAECIKAMINYAKQKGIAWAQEMLEAYFRNDMDAIRNCPDADAAPIADHFQPLKRPDDFENVSLKKSRTVPAPEKQWNCFEMEMRWLENAAGSNAQRIEMHLHINRDIITGLPEKLQPEMENLVMRFDDEEIDGFSGREFALLGFETSLKKILTERICRCGGKVSASAGKTTDYAIIHISGLAKDAEKIAKAANLRAAGGNIRLKSELLLWRALNNDNNDDIEK